MVRRVKPIFKWVSLLKVGVETQNHKEVEGKEESFLAVLRLKIKHPQDFQT